MTQSAKTEKFLDEMWEALKKSSPPTPTDNGVDVLMTTEIMFKKVMEDFAQKISEAGCACMCGECYE